MRLTKKIRGLDIFGKDVGFKFGGHSNLTSVFGGALSVLTFMIVLAFAAVKFAILVRHQDNKYMSIERENYLDTDQEFTGKEMGFNVMYTLELAKPNQE